MRVINCNQTGVVLRKLIRFKCVPVIVLLLLSLASYFKEQEKNRLLISANQALSDKNETLALNLAPTCNFGQCPTYKSGDTDGDGDSESLVVVPVSMTKGGGEVWIIDEGKVVFKSDGQANISVKAPGYEVVNNEGGFIITYTKEYDGTGLRPKTWATEEWKYEKGNYMLKRTTFDE